MSSCKSCIAAGYPEVYSPARQIVGLVVATLVGVLVLIGFVVFWLRRHERLIAARSNWVIYLSAANAIVIGTYAVREHVGEGQWPCIVQGLVDCWSCIALPACLVLRVIGTYAKHLRQRTLLGLSRQQAYSEMEGDTRTKSMWHACSSCMSRVDAILLRYNVHKSRSQLQAAAVCATPWFIFYVIELIIDPPLRTLGAVGCRDGSITITIIGVNVTLFVLLLLPFYVALLRMPDTLYIRHEIIVEAICVPLLLVWYLIAKLTPGFEVNYLSGNYATIAYACLIFFVSTFLPGMLSFLPHERARGALTSTVASGDMVALSSDPLSTAELNDVDKSCIQQPYVNTVVVRPYTIPENLVEALKEVRESRLFVADVSLREAKKVLGLPGQDVSANSRALRIAGSLLIALESGRQLLFEELAREFCVEIVAFLVASNALRATVEAYVKERKSASCRVIAGSLYGSDGVALMNSNREEVGHVPLEFASLVERLTSLMLTFVVPSAELQVNLDSQRASALTAAASAMAAAHASSAQLQGASTADNDAARISASEQLLSALFAAEKEIFYLLVSGPLFHLVQRARYAAWASKVLRAASPPSNPSISSKQLF